jgi:hypothetical protein
MAEWKIRRGEDEFSAPDAATLQQWAASGNLAASDYVLNPILQQWMYARDLAELAGVFGMQAEQKRVSEMNRMSWGVGALGLLTLLVFPPAGVVLIIIALCMSAYATVKKTPKPRRVPDKAQSTNGPIYPAK